MSAESREPLALRPAPRSGRGSGPPHRRPGLSREDAAGLAKTVNRGHRPREGPRPPREVLRKPRHGAPPCLPRPGLVATAEAPQRCAIPDPSQEPHHLPAPWPRPQPSPGPCSLHPVSLPSQAPGPISTRSPQRPFQKSAPGTGLSRVLPAAVHTQHIHAFSVCYQLEGQLHEAGVVSLCPLPSPEPE